MNTMGLLWPPYLFFGRHQEQARDHGRAGQLPLRISERTHLLQAVDVDVVVLGKLP